jgi:O-antigen ligase
MYKASPRFTWVPVDITLLTAIVSFMCGAWLVVSGRVRVPRSALTIPVLMVALGLWMAISLTWAPPSAFSGYKVAYMLTMTLWSLLGAVIIAQDPLRVRRLVGVVIAAAAWFTVEALLFGRSRAAPSLAASLGSTYLGYGIVIGTGIVALFGVATADVLPPTLRVLALLGLGPMLLAVLNSGGRGPLLGLVPALLLVPVLGAARLDLQRRSVRLRPGGVAAGVVLLVAALSIVPMLGETQVVQEHYALQRLQRLREDETLGYRLPLFRAAIRAWADRPLLGHGAGSYASASGTGYQYPHNPVLEALSECGIVGGVLYLALVGAAIWRLVARGGVHADPLRLIVLCMLTYLLFQAMKSGDLEGDRPIYALLGLASMGPATGAPGTPGTPGTRSRGPHA